LTAGVRPTVSRMFAYLGIVAPPISYIFNTRP